MIEHSETRNSKYSSEQMFDLVADVESYPAFIPWCTKVTTISRKRDADRQLEILEADMSVSFKVFTESFVSRVSLDPSSKEILVEYLSGPFKFLHNRWFFINSEDGCNINFYVSFEFKSKIMQHLIGVVFYEAMKRIVRSFEKRADELYR